MTMKYAFSTRYSDISRHGYLFGNTYSLVNVKFLFHLWIALP